LALQEVDLIIHYCPGKSNVCADSLSRSPLGQPDINVDDSVGGAKNGEKSESSDGVKYFEGEESSLDKQSDHLIIKRVRNKESNRK